MYLYVFMIICDLACKCEFGLVREYKPDFQKVWFKMWLCFWDVDVGVFMGCSNGAHLRCWSGCVYEMLIEMFLSKWFSQIILFVLGI